MVYLNRIYTKTGDAGETSLGNGNRVPKTHPRIIAYGTVDELNSILGLVMTANPPGEIAGWLKNVQNTLFDLGADLCVPESDEPTEHHPLRATVEQVEAVERWIDLANEKLKPLESFILPGGSLPSAHLHHARTVCRRAEIAALHLAEIEPINPQVIIYLNRLSDLLFVLARVCNDNGSDDILWEPGGKNE